MNIGLLVSGQLGFKILIHLYKSYNLSFVLTDRQSTPIIDFAHEHKIPLYVGNPRTTDLPDYILHSNIHILLSVNYLFIIDAKLIELPQNLSINIHGSLLPKYRGRTPHVWAIINNESQTGITAHVIDEGCDTGDIIEQLIIPIGKQDTGADILEKFEHAYPQLIDRVLHNVEQGSVHPIPQDHSLATYFGKRTPDDGKIDWNWQKERIHNWVRSQAYPYPGAFTLYNDQKIIIDRISFHDLGFNDEIPNGTILNTNPILVKTPNGVIQLEQIRNKYLNVKVGTRFN